MAPTYRTLIDQATGLLYDSSDSPRIDAEVLLQHVTNESLAWLIAYGDSAASPEHTKLFFKLIAKRQEGHPIAYIVGYKEFWSLQLKVNEHVLVPRADTETLVEECLRRIDPDAATKILDLGTGSGAIALAIAKERPHSQVLAVDLEENALEVAMENKTTHQLANVEMMQSCWYSNIGNQQFDLIAANPPYVAHDDPHLKQGDLRYEPMSALACAKNGLSDLETIINQAPQFLKNGGHLVVEHGCEQAEEVMAIFHETRFIDINLHLDLHKLPRCTSGQWIS